MPPVCSCNHFKWGLHDHVPVMCMEKDKSGWKRTCARARGKGKPCKNGYVKCVGSHTRAQRQARRVIDVIVKHGKDSAQAEAELDRLENRLGSAMKMNVKNILVKYACKCRGRRCPRTFDAAFECYTPARLAVMSKKRFMQFLATDEESAGLSWAVETDFTHPDDVGLLIDSVRRSQADVGSEEFDASKANGLPFGGLPKPDLSQEPRQLSSYELDELLAENSAYNLAVASEDPEPGDENQSPADNGNEDTSAARAAMGIGCAAAACGAAGVAALIAVRRRQSTDSKAFAAPGTEDESFAELGPKSPGVGPEAGTKGDYDEMEGTVNEVPVPVKGVEHSGEVGASEI